MATATGSRFTLQAGEQKVIEIDVEGIAEGTTRVKASVTMDGIEEDLIDTDQVIIY
ncbi:MAG: hypothetical protein R3B96_12620 [Pirellulaceae bacterium]